MIRNKALFIEKVMPKWFYQLKFVSFQRQLNLFGFKKIYGQGPDKGGIYHPKFLRGRPNLAGSIQRTKSNKGSSSYAAAASSSSKNGRSSKTNENEPNFYNMTFLTEEESQELQEDCASMTSTEERQDSPSPVMTNSMPTSIMEKRNSLSLETNEVSRNKNEFPERAVQYIYTNAIQDRGGAGGAAGPTAFGPTPCMMPTSSASVLSFSTSSSQVCGGGGRGQPLQQQQRVSRNDPQDLTLQQGAMFSLGYGGVIPRGGTTVVQAVPTAVYQGTISSQAQAAVTGGSQMARRCLMNNQNVSIEDPLLNPSQLSRLATMFGQEDFTDLEPTPFKPGTSAQAPAPAQSVSSSATSEIQEILQDQQRKQQQQQQMQQAWIPQLTDSSWQLLQQQSLQCLQQQQSASSSSQMPQYRGFP